LLARLRVDDEEWQRIVAAREGKRRPVPVPEFVEVTGAKGDVLKGLQHKLSGLAGTPINPRELDEKMMDVTGLGRFARAGYRDVVRDGHMGSRSKPKRKITRRRRSIPHWSSTGPTTRMFCSKLEGASRSSMSVASARSGGTILSPAPSTD